MSKVNEISVEELLQRTNKLLKELHDPEVGVILPDENPAVVKYKVLQVIKTEGGTDLAPLLWGYANMVDFEAQACAPIIKKDNRFFSALEDLGRFGFEIERRKLNYLKQIRDNTDNLFRFFAKSKSETSIVTEEPIEDSSKSLNDIDKLF